MNNWQLEKITMNDGGEVTFLVRGEEGDCGENVYCLLDWQGASPDTLEDAAEYDWYPLDYYMYSTDKYCSIPPAIAAGEVDFVGG